jgi:hypothetical protein
LDLVLTVPSYEHLAMDDPGGPAPRDAALPETRGYYEHLASRYVQLSPSARKIFFDDLIAASTTDYMDDYRSCTPKNPKACLIELPNELLVHIFKFADDRYKRRSLTCLSLTSRKLKVLAAELLYRSIRIKDGSFFPKILATLKKNAHLATSVRSMTLDFSVKAQDSQIKLHRLPDIIPNIQDLTIMLSGRYRNALSGDSLRTMSSKLWDYPTLKELNICVSINLALFRHFLSLPFLEILSCDLPDSVQSTAPWKPLVPKSRVRNLIIAKLDNFETISQITSSVESLRHLCLAHSSSKHLMDPSVSWSTITQGLLKHKESLESLAVLHDAKVDFRSWGTFRDFPILEDLAFTLDYASDELPEEPSLLEILPKRLRMLSVDVCPLWPEEEAAGFYYKELLSLKEHHHLEAVKISLRGRLVVPPTEPRLSTVVETLQNSGIRVELWRGRSTSQVIEVVKFLRNWENELEVEDEEEQYISDGENEEENLIRSRTPTGTDPEED